MDTDPVNKRAKPCNSNAVDPRALWQLREMVDKEGIVAKQKISIYVEMLGYMKMNEELESKNEELAEENANLVMMLENHKENVENACESKGKHNIDGASKIVMLSNEVRRLGSVICEMEKRLAKRDIDGYAHASHAESNDVSNTRMKQADVSLVSMANDETYRRIVDECSELKSKLVDVEAKYKEEMYDKELVISKLSGELNNLSISQKEAERKCAIFNGENEKNKGIIDANASRIRRLIDDAAILNMEIEKIERDMLPLICEIEKNESKTENLLMEKAAFKALVEGYEEREEKIKTINANGDSALEDEIINLLESLDKGLERNKELTKKVEESHRRCRVLQDEVNVLKAANSDLASHNAKLEIGMNFQKKNVKNSRVDNGETLAKIRKLQDCVEELNRIVDEYKRRLHGLSAEKNEMERILECVKKQSRELRNEVVRLTKANNEAECETKKLHGVLKSIRARGEDVDLLTQMERYRGLLRCMLCDSRFKNTAIVKCMHCFCEECVNSRIKMRDRKCPSCNEPFNTSDVRKIYL
ncbi:hypothetical protein HK407_04g08430 [Ordospora pajunii]|uniref:uncharacterized protein n=1 Tax=Ordospora pajunii TaxID=3039483 RepID=UPI00295269AC|nr:uncharacterized protein HK407_04g08430 [Ordospora pajunii]KAH9411732.1 hypothetical protein HK407_04g08430 [Ordospora pajunii]